MKIVGILVALGFSCVLGLTGCRAGQEASEPPVQEASAGQDPAERDSVLALLRALDPGTMGDAFARLPRHRFKRYRRTEQRDAAYGLVALRERITRHEAAATVLQADSTGTFDFGYLAPFVRAASETTDATNLPQHVLPEDPPYLAPRSRDAYTYRFLPDTTLWNAAVRVIEVRARPGAGDGMNIRQARFYVTDREDELVGLVLERRERRLLFREASRFYLQVRPGPDGGWLPFLTRISVRLDAPLRKPYTFHTASAYYDYDPGG